MTKSTGFLAVVLICGCSTAPISFYGVAPPGRDTAYECALAQLNILGYTIEDGNKDAGFIRGRKQTSGLGTQLFTGASHHELLTATVFDDPATGTNLRVVAARVADQDTSPLGALGDESPEQGESAIAPSEVGKADARVLLANCGVTNVIGPIGGQQDFALLGAASGQDVYRSAGDGSAGIR